MPEAPQPLRRLPASLCAIALLLAVFAYRGALTNPFVYDDHVVVVENASIRSVSDVAAIVLHDVKRPLVNFSYAVDHALWGLAPFGFHVTNLLLHLLNVALFFALARRVAADHDELSGHEASDGRPLVVAFVAAALLAVHPLMTQAVGYVAARADLLCATFAILSVLAYRRFVRSGRHGWLAASVAAWLVSVGAKETAVMLPPIIVLYDWLILAPLVPGWRSRLRQVHLPLAGIMSLVALARVGLLLGVEHGPSERLHWTHALVEADVLRHYLSLLVVPARQSIFHPVATITSVTDPRGVFAVLWVMSLLVIMVRVGVRNRLAAIGVAWFVLLLVPSAVLVMFDLGEPMAEHRAYLASMGIFITAGCGAAGLWSLAAGRSFAWRASLALCVVVILGTLTSLTIARNRVWSDPVRLWTEAVGHAPDIWVTHLMLGQELQIQQRFAEAVDSYARAIQLRPEEPYAYLKSGVCLVTLGRLDEAARMFDRARVMQPASPRPLLGLGTVASLAGRHTEARRWFLEAVDRQPVGEDAREALGRSEIEARLALCEPLTGDEQRACLARQLGPQPSR